LWGGQEWVCSYLNAPSVVECQVSCLFHQGYSVARLWFGSGALMPADVLVPVDVQVPVLSVETPRVLAKVQAQLSSLVAPIQNGEYARHDIWQDTVWASCAPALHGGVLPDPIEYALVVDSAPQDNGGWPPSPQ
jgi:hypothetical protein